MFRAAVVLALVGACFASYGRYSRKCYQCEYVPPKQVTRTEYETQEYELKTPVTTVMCKYGYSYRGDTHEYGGGDYSDAGRKGMDPGYDAAAYPADCSENTVYETETRTRQVPKTVTYTKPAGGFGACKGPIDYATAADRGVDDWDCPNNCYVRTDSYGRITRGCYKHELDVDPNVLGCSQQGGYNYCFCSEDHCNNH